jgi:hypothetical protein
MADITLKTRLLNKYNQTLAADHVLGKGEINFVEVDIPLGNGGKGKAVLIKVGDGQTAYSSLDFVAAKAADVYDWAKAATKPEYQASEIKNLESYIAGKVQDTNTKYEFKVSEDGKLIVDEKELSGTTSTVATLDFVTPTELNTILNGYVSDTELSTALEDYLTTAVFETFKGTNTTAIADAKKAGTDAAAALESYKEVADKAIADEVKAREDAFTSVSTVIGEVEENKTVVQMIADAKTAATYDDTALAGRVTTIEGDYLKAADKTELNNAITAEKTRAEGIEAGLRTDVDAIEADYLKAADKTELEGKITTAQNTATAAKEAIDAFLLDAEVSGDAVDTLKEIQAGLDAGEASAASLLKEINTLKAVDNATQAELDTAVNDLDGKIAKKADASAVTAIDGRVAALEAIDHVSDDDVATAKSEAIAAAATDAKSKADAALEAAKSDATTKADKALADAKDYADKLNHEDTTYEAGKGLTLNVVDGKNTFALDTSVVFILDGNA